MAQLEDRIDTWLAHCPNPKQDPLPGMQQAGLLAPAPDYATLAGIKAALVERTGLLGIGSVWGGRQLVFRHFIRSFGTERQQAEWEGRALSVAISEPKVGAHPKLLTTRAERQSDGFRITGQKAWVSNGPSAEAIIVFAITAQERGRKRYSAFLVPRDAAGLSISEMPDFHALRPSRHCLLTLAACEVPTSAMLGATGTAYERMALPFRDIEDAVGTFGTLGALRHAIALLAGPSPPGPQPPRPEPAGRNQMEAEQASRAQAGLENAGLRQTEAEHVRPEQAGPEQAGPEQVAELGAIVALTAVFEAGAASVVTALDGGHFGTGDATLVGLRLLAIDIVARLRAQAERPGLPRKDALLAIITDLDATLSIARGPRLVRQAQLGRTALGSGTSQK